MEMKVFGCIFNAKDWAIVPNVTILSEYIRQYYYWRFYKRLSYSFGDKSQPNRDEGRL